MGHEGAAGSGTVWGTEDRGQRFPALAGDELADVVVVGAGIAGLSVARELARSGRKVAVLERHVVGAGVTGHTTAKVSVLQGARLAALARRHGEQTAAAFVESQTAAMLHVADVVRRLGVDCDLEERPAYLFSEDVEDLTTLQGLLYAGKLRPVIDRRYRLRELAEAFGYLEAGHARGKVIATVEHDRGA